MHNTRQTYRSAQCLARLLMLLCCLGLISQLLPTQTRAAGQAERSVLLLTQTGSPILQALSRRVPVKQLSTEALTADEPTVRAALQSALALAADASALAPDSIQQSHWFRVAHELGVPMMIENAEDTQMVAITGLGITGRFVMLRPGGIGQEVQVHRLGQTPAEHTDPVSIATQAQALLGAPALRSTLAALPDASGVPARAIRVWDIVPEPPTPFGTGYAVRIPGTTQTALDDVRFKVGLYSVSQPLNKKFLVVQTTGAGGGVNVGTLTADTSTDRGFYLESYTVTAGPTDPRQTLLQIESRAPQAANSESQYTTSTGFSLSASTSAEIGYTYSESAAETSNIPDFKVEYLGSSTEARWVYRLAKVANGYPYTTWRDLVNSGVTSASLRGLPGLASRETLNPQNESVWSIDGDFQGIIPFRVAHQALLRRVTINSFSIGSGASVTNQEYRTPLQEVVWPVDFSLVNFSGDLSIYPQSITITPDAALPAGSVWLSALVEGSQASYDDIAVTFFNGPPADGKVIGTAVVDVPAIFDGPTRRGYATARVPWAVADLPGTQTVWVQITKQDGELDAENNTSSRTLNLTAPRINLSANQLNLGEGGQAASVQVSLSTQPSANVIIVPESDGQLRSVPEEVVFTPANWNTPRTIAISAIDDEIVEGPHAGQMRFQVTSADGSYHRMLVDSVSSVITDNDNVSPKVVRLAEGGDGDSYLFGLTRKPSASVTISITTDGRSTVSPATLVFPVETWDRPQTVVVSAVDDTASGDRSSTITHRAISDDATYNGVTLESITAQIRDNDVPGATIEVTTAADVVAVDGVCSLREAVQAANSQSSVNECRITPQPYHVINLAAPGPYDLTITDPVERAQLKITSAIVINGNGQTLRNRAEQGRGRLFSVPTGGDLTVNNLTIRDGNNAANGGAIQIFGGTVSLYNCVVTDNAAPGGSGGAILNAGTLNIYGSTLTNNTAEDQNAISGEGGGGAIYNAGVLNIANTTIAGNRSWNDGAGIYNNNGVVRLTHVTITGNTADSNNDGIGQGGGVITLRGTVHIKNSLVAGNFDTMGGVGPEATTPDITRKADTARSLYLGTIRSEGYNLIGTVGAYNFDTNTIGDIYGDPSGATAVRYGATELTVVVDPLFEAGASIYSLQPASPAIDRIPSESCRFISASNNPLFTDTTPAHGDQRGDLRPRGLRCDIGAHEAAAPGVGVSTARLNVPTGQYGSVYQLVLKTAPTNDVQITLSTDGATTVEPRTITFTAQNWNTPQQVTVRASDGASTRGLRTLAGQNASMISHTLTSTDPAYTSSIIPSITARIVRVPNLEVGGRAIYLPLVQR